MDNIQKILLCNQRISHAKSKTEMDKIHTSKECFDLLQTNNELKKNFDKKNEEIEVANIMLELSRKQIGGKTSKSHSKKSFKKVIQKSHSKKHSKSIQKSIQNRKTSI
jgi:hypothetical protein